MTKKQNLAPFSRTQKQKQLLIKVIFMMYLNQSILRLYQTYKNLLEKIRVGCLNVLIKQNMCFIMKTLFKISIEAKKIHRGCIRIQSITMAKTISRI